MNPEKFEIMRKNSNFILLPGFVADSWIYIRKENIVKFSYTQDSTILDIWEVVNGKLETYKYTAKGANSPYKSGHIEIEAKLLRSVIIELSCM